VQSKQERLAVAFLAAKVLCRGSKSGAHSRAKLSFPYRALHQDTFLNDHDMVSVRHSNYQALPMPVS
jgi:hypothetical protein